jgi:hypothetical protein
MKSTDKPSSKLWSFVYAPFSKKTVTSVIWNSKYEDLFACAYGQYEFGK